MPETLAPLSINIPDRPEHTVYTVIGDKIIFVTIEHDQDCENPCTSCDGFGTIRSLSHLHINSISLEDAEELLASDPDVVRLSYFEHGASLWMVMNSPAPAGVEFRWDGRRFAGIWIPDQCCKDSYTGQDGKAREQWMLEQAASACKEYTEWANGYCYGYTINAYDVIRDDDGEPMDDENDYRRKTPIFEDSCWGYIGWDCAVQATKDALPETL